MNWPLVSLVTFDFIIIYGKVLKATGVVRGRGVYYAFIAPVMRAENVWDKSDALILDHENVT